MCITIPSNELLERRGSLLNHINQTLNSEEHGVYVQTASYSLMFSSSTLWRTFYCLTDSEYKASHVFHPRDLTYLHSYILHSGFTKGNSACLDDSRSYFFLPSLSLQSSAQAISGRKTNCDTDHTIHLGHCSSSPGSICADMKHRG